jgi:hypothetical protein
VGHLGWSNGWGWVAKGENPFDGFVSKFGGSVDIGKSWGFGGVLSKGKFLSSLDVIRFGVC